jgi:type I restriction enzyme S subunit
VPLDWKIYKQGEVATFINGRAYKNSEFKENGTPIIRIQNLKGVDSGKIVYSDLVLDDDKYIEKDDLIYAWSATFGPHIWKGPRSIYHYHIWKIVCNENLIDKYFFFYKLKYISDRISAQGTGSIFSHITKTLMENQEIGIPQLNEQRRISQILKSLDDKIELNNTINKNLEEIAQALFKRWFVDFEFPNEDGEPYKTSGGEFEDSELGPIPKGWKPGTIGELGEVAGGATPSKKVDAYYTERGIPWITPKDLSKTTNKYIARGEIDITEEGFRNSSVKLLPKDTVLFSSRAPIGYIAIAKNEVTTNQGFKSVIPLEHIGSEFVYYLLKSNVEKIENRASGSTFKEISGSEMRKVPVLIPPKDVLAKFNEIVEPLGRLMQKCEEEIEALTQIRDTLLPKLMSGEIRVPVEQEQAQEQTREQKHSIYQPSYNDLPMAAESKADYRT